MNAPGGILGRIVSRTLEDVLERRSRISPGELQEHAHRRAGLRRNLVEALRRGDSANPVRFLCEIKRASPSRGPLAPDLDPGDLAGTYRDNGASAISVVTEPHFFQGEESLLHAAREAVPSLPLLRKDFHVHELQILETAAGPADALLLLAAALSATQLKDYLDIAGEFSLGHLVEVNDTREAESALRAGARVIGVNNRDLVTFDVDVARTERVLPALRDAGVVAVAESGIHDRETVVHLQECGVDALLVGESLVTAPDAGLKLRELRGAPPPSS